MAAKSPRGFFTRVQQAREALREKAEEIIAEYMDTAAKAKDAGDYETAMKAYQWLIEHMPADEVGSRLVDSSIDKQQKQIDVKPTGPAIQIGIAVGGIGQDQKALPKPTVEVIDVEQD